MTYQPGIPTGSVPLNQDYLNIQANFTQINDQFSIDHVPLNSTSGSPPNGYHTVVHMFANSTIAGNPPNNYPPTPPANASLTGELYTTQSNNGIFSDEILWYQSGGGRVLQLSGNFTPTISQNGATFLPGGLILNWGYFNSSGGSGQVVNLTQKFPKNFYNAQATMVRNVSNVDVIYCQTTPGVAPSGGITTLTFRDTSSGNPFFWYAIGN